MGILGTTREAYFPRGTWFDIHGNLIVSDMSQGTTLTISSVLSESPTFIRGGSVIPILVIISIFICIYIIKLLWGLNIKLTIKLSTYTLRPF